MLSFCLLSFLLLAVGNIMDSLKFRSVNASPIWTRQKERGNLQYFQLQQHRSREILQKRTTENCDWDWEEKLLFRHKLQHSDTMLKTCELKPFALVA